MDAKVAESAKKLWLEEIPASHKHGTNQHSEGEDNGNHCPNMNAPGLLARLKRDHPNLAQQVIDGELSATRAAREVRRVAPRTTCRTKRGKRLARSTV